MNIIDIITALVAIVAVVSGWRKGFAVQVFSLAAVIVGVWIASMCGARVGAWLHVEPKYAQIAGFAVVLVVVIVALILIGRMMRGVFKSAGLGGWDTVLGVGLSLVKWAFIMGVVFTLFDALNAKFSLVEQRTLASSRSYYPLCRVVDKVVVGWHAVRRSGEEFFNPKTETEKI